MSLTKRTIKDVLDNTLVATGSVSGATTKLTMVYTASNSYWGVQGTINVYVNGTKQSCSWTTNKTSTMMGTTYKIKMTSQQLTISKPFFTLKLTDSYDGRELLNQEFSFYEIEKAPTAATTSGGVMDGSTKSRVVFTTSGTDATYKATFTLGSYTGSATSTTKTLEYAIPIAWCNAVPNAVTAQANVTCQVLFGGQVYSSFTVKLTVSVPTSVVPTLTSITLADKTDTPVPSAWNMFIQHKSGVRVSAITTAGAYSSTIAQIKLQVGTQSVSQAYSASSLPVIDTITQSGSLTCTVTVTDSRGRTASKTATVTFVPYAAPKFTACVSERCLANGTVDNDGTYFKSTTAVSFSTCNGKNSISMTVKYKKTDAVVYGTEAAIEPGVNTCGNNDLDTEFSYDVMYEVTDQFCTVSFTDYISTAVYLMHFLHGGKGVAFGQKATMENYLDCAFKALFRDDAFFMTGNGVQVNIRDIITIGAQTLTSFGNGLFLCAKDGKLIGQVPSIGTDTPTSLTNGQFLYANNGKVGSKTISLSSLTDAVIKAGDTLTVGIWGFGTIMTASTEMYLIYSLGRPITASSATLVSGVMTVRSTQGFVYNKASASGGVFANINMASYSPEISITKEIGMIRIKLTNSTKWVTSGGTAITNCTPIVMSSSLSLRFS